MTNNPPPRDAQTAPDVPHADLLPWETHNPGDLGPDYVNVLCPEADVIILAKVEIHTARLIVSEHNAAFRAGTPARAGKIKPLVWEHVLGTCHRAFGVGLEYEVAQKFETGDWFWWPNNTPHRLSPPFSTIEEAETAAQADYEARILAALQPGEAQGADEADLDEAWKSGFNAGFGEAILTKDATPPAAQGAEPVADDAPYGMTKEQRLDWIKNGPPRIWLQDGHTWFIRPVGDSVEYSRATPPAAQVTAPQWGDETCLRFAEGYDREDAAQRGEPSPHDVEGEDYAEWAMDRIACVRAALRALAGEK